MREKEMTAHVASVGADAGQSPQNICIDSIAHTKEKINDFHQIYEADERNFPLSKNSRKLKTVTMEELYGKVFDATLPIIEGGALSRDVSFCRASQGRKKFSDGATCLSR